MSDVSLTNMRVPENGSFSLRLRSVDHYILQKVNEFVRETFPTYQNPVIVPFEMVVNKIFFYSLFDRTEIFVYQFVGKASCKFVFKIFFS